MTDSVLQRRLTLGEMLDAPTFNEVVKGFVELYRIGIKVFDERGAKLADVKIGNGDFCGYVFSFGEGRARCTSTVARVKDGAIAPVEGARPAVLGDEAQGREVIAVTCFTGLRYLIMPLVWEGDRLGRIIFGPFIPDDLSGLPSSLLSMSQEAQPATLESLMSRVRRAPEATVARVLTHFAQLVDTLVAAGQKIYLTSQLHVEATLETNRELEAKNRQLQEMNERLTELDLLKSSFLATVSHELRTPLTSIIGYSEMLAEGLGGPLTLEQMEFVRTIQEKGETLLRLISSILDISQIRAGKVKLSFEPLDVLEVVRSSVTSVMPQAQKKRVSLDARLPSATLAATADRDRLRQVIVNLLANAVKFTPAGGVVSIFVSDRALQPELGEDGYRVIVEDSGVGIPEDQFDKIFLSFYQVDSSSTREFGGAGLGLAIVKSFIEGHGGVVKVTSELGRGSRFTVVMPTTPPAPRSVEVAPPAMPDIPDRF